ncbi:DUF2818 family protein [Paenalcaligenes niemegkensis]|uniref:DUF2818 family protein n=1 Tax=Paenalcaligenes niemegkensis TaxID=2895469 RepID=UPI001EE997A3|nr:DUF2818 family protein [Paenalcaligenes niemegkensis]MCQ9616922.1 DUF2818 family protein [Paenalcaligenes niemegkensis]
MNQSVAVWVLIVLSLITANLAFVSQRPLLFLPWQQQGEPLGSPLLRLLRSLLFAVIVAGIAYVAHRYIAQSFFNSSVPLLLMVVLVVVVFAILLYIPGYLLRQHPIHKSVFDRLVEMFVLFCLMGILGFAFEASIGNPFPQRWEFYAIALCLYLVLGYPGFVFRYLIKRRQTRSPKAVKA